MVGVGDVTMEAKEVSMAARARVAMVAADKVVRLAVTTSKATDCESDCFLTVHRC